MRWLAAATGLAIGLVLVACWSAEAVRALLIGWAQFLLRVLPRLSVDWRTVLAALVVFVLLTLGVHWFARAALRVRGSERRWKFTWSLVAVTIVVVAFISGICMIGVTHQTGWLLTNEQPAIVVRESVRYGVSNSSKTQLIELMLGLQQAVEDGDFHHDGREENVRHSWVTHSLAYCSFTQSNKNGDRIDFNLPWNDPINRPLFTGPMPLVINPELPGAPLRDTNGFGLAHYAANSRAMANGVIRPSHEFTDGTGNTLLIGEVNANFRPWGDPANVRDPARGINRSPYGFGGPPDTNGALFGMADGSVRFVSERVSPAVLRALATPDGGEQVDLNVLEKP